MMTSFFSQMEDDPNFSKMEDDQKNSKIEEYLNFFENGRKPQFFTNAVNLFLVTASFLLKTFLGLAQLSKIYSYFVQKKYT